MLSAAHVPQPCALALLPRPAATALRRTAGQRPDATFLTGSLIRIYTGPRKSSYYLRPVSIFVAAALVS